jgi:hypothetical protein
MKKNLLSLMSLVVLGAVATQAQDTWVTGSAPVKVQGKTMFYHGGTLNVKTGSTAVVTNDGYIYVKNSNLNNAVNEDNFILTHTSDATNSYGQLITNGGTQNVGKITMQKMIGAQGGAFQSAFPFASYTYQDWATNHNYNITGKTPCGVGVACLSSERAKHAMFKWDNANLRFDPVQANEALDPKGYYVVRQTTATGLTNYIGNTKAFKGIPNGVSSSVVVSNTSSVDFGANGVNRNVYRIPYSTYIDDNYDTSAWSPNYGRYQMQLGNPFTSNIDLSYIGLAEPGTTNDGNNIPSIRGIWYYTTSRVLGGTGLANDGGVSVKQITTETGQFDTGDIPNLIIRPLQPFVIKGTSSMVGQTFTFTDGLKTFKDTSKASDYGAAGGTGATNYTTFSTSSANPITSQIKLWASDDQGQIGENVYFAVSELFNSGELKDLVVKSSPLVGFYSLPESLNGGINLEQAATGYKIYANKISPDFKFKAIPLAFNAIPGVKGSLKINAQLFYGGLLLKDAKFADSNIVFIFHDKLTNVFKEVTTDFNYEFTQLTDTQDRFEIYYGGVENLSTEDSNLEKSTTIVYKNTSNNSYNVRFAKGWNNASVKVYSISGQLISSASKVDTSVDYVVPVKENGVYIVAVQNENGEEVKQKIIK